MTAIIITVILAFGLYGSFIEPYRVQVQHYYIENSSLAAILSQKRVVQITDLHIKRIGYLEKQVLTILKQVDPDFLFLTGDYIQWEGDCEAALTFLSMLTAKEGMWAVMGDYDYSNSRKSCLFCHQPERAEPSKRHHIKFLRNSWERIKLQNGVLLVGGIDPEANSLPSLSESSKPAGAGVPAIVLSHNPMNYDQFNDDDDVLVLSGDTHGGQVPAPSWLWKVMGYEKNSRFSQGLFEVGRKKMLVSRGIGTSHFPFRILRPPEVAILHFK